MNDEYRGSVSDVDQFFLSCNSEDEDENDEEKGPTSLKRKREKLTRAQLNKRKARNMASHEDFKKKEVKELLKSLDSLPRVIKSIEADEKRLEDMKAIREVSRRQMNLR